MDEILQGKEFSAKGGPASGWKCAFCGGTGIQPHSLKSRCFACRGKGEVEFEGPAVTCPSCKGKGRSPGALRLACIRCKGVGGVVVVNSVKSQTTEPSVPPLAGTSNEVPKGEAADVLGERLGEIMKRLTWTRKETEEKTKEIEKRLKPVKTFISAFGGKEVKKEIVWLEKLGNNLKKEWESLWKQ